MRRFNLSCSATAVLSVLVLVSCQEAPTDALLLPGAGIQLRLSPDALDQGRVGDDYRAVITAEGPDGVAYTWQLRSPLPPDLVFEVQPAAGPDAVIQGVPRVAGAFDVDIEVQAAGRSVRRTFQIRILPEDVDPLRIEVGPVQVANLGEPFAVDLEAVGGEGAVMWSVVAGGVPGLGLVGAAERQARLSGEPIEAGTFSVTVRAMDTFGGSGDATFEVTVAGPPEPLVFEDQILAPATTGVAYEAVLTAIGGAGGYTWTALDPVPDGLTLNPTGTPGTVLRGVPSRAAFFTFRVQVEDAAGSRAIAELLLRVDARGLTIVTESLPDGIATATYRGPVLGGGGTGAYTWRVVEGALPPGVSLSPFGTPQTEVAGIPEQPGTYNFTLELEDSAEVTVRRSFRLVIEAPPRELTLLTTNPQTEGTRCLGYDQPLEVTGGQPGYTWILESGSLPPGVSLSAARGPRVELSGAPTQAGVYRFTVAVIDAQNDRRSLSVRLTVTDDPTVGRLISFAGNIVSDIADTFIADVCGPQPGTPITVTPAGDRTPIFAGGSAPVISPDGSKLAFVGPLTAGDEFVRDIARLYVVDLSGSAPGPAVNLMPANAHRPLVTGFQWSPDSQKLVFRGLLTRAQSYELFTVDVSNPAAPGAPTRVSGNLAPGGEVLTAAYAWSPDSTTVAYVADQRRAGTFEIFFGQPNRSVAAHPPLPVGRSIDPVFLWRADSGGIFFRGDPVGNDDDFALFHVAWSNRRPGPLSQVSPPAVVDGDVALDRFWLSANGEWLAFVGDLDRDDSENVYVSRVIGGNQGAAPPTVVNPPFARDRTISQVRWSPDGSALVILGDLLVREAMELFYVSFSGGMVGGPVRLNPTLSAFSAVQGTRQTEFWSADSNWVGFMADLRRDDKLELYVVDLRIAPPWRALRVSPATANDRLDTFRFEFAPDGSRIAFLGDYSTRDQFELWAVDLRGPSPGAGFRVHGNLPGGAFVRTGQADTAWKRDGSALFFRADLSRRFVEELWMVDMTADGRAPPVQVNPRIQANGDVLRFGFTP